MRWINGREHFTPAEASRALGLTRSQVYGLLHRRTLRAEVVGHQLYIPRAEVERYASLLAGDAQEQVAARLLRASGVRQRLIFSWRN